LRSHGPLARSLTVSAVRDDGLAGQSLDMTEATVNPDISYPLGWEAEQPLQGPWDSSEF